MTEDSEEEHQYGKRLGLLIADQFWKQWAKEYLITLQLRHIVLAVNEITPHMCWPLGRVTRVNKGNDGLVRSVDVNTDQLICETGDQGVSAGRCIIKTKI